jgi:hypothetical protein
MDWKQFIASIVGSLAWPAVIIVLLILLRHKLGELVSRMEELKLPGGVSAKFGKELEAARQKIEESKAAQEVPKEPVRWRTTDSAELLYLAEEFPEAAVMEAFRQVEHAIGENRDKLPDIPKGTLLSYVKVLAQRGLVDKVAVDLFQRLRNLRNIAAHGSGADRVTPGEALEYYAQCVYMAQVLRAAFNKL